MIELRNLSNRKIRLVALKSKQEMEIFISIFNLVASFRRYEHVFGENAGPQFISLWVKDYMKH